MDVNDDEKAIEQVFLPRHCVKGTKGINIHDDIKKTLDFIKINNLPPFFIAILILKIFKN